MAEEAKDLSPWEDTLILAFRDLQWVRRQRDNAEKLETTFKAQRKEWTGRQYFDWVEQTLTTPPPLLAKLDGRAESASGDVLTAQNDRFFLLEFKASFSKFSQEKDKYIKRLMDFVGEDMIRYETFIDLSLKGHFLVYPTFADGSSGSSGSLLPIHEATLRAAPYFGVCRSTTSGPSQKPEETKTLERVIWTDKQGLTLEEMAAYLFALSQSHGTGSGGHPMKVVVASANGMVWPVADLSQLATLQTYFSSQKAYSQDEFTQLADQLQPLISDFKASPPPPVMKPEVDKPNDDKKKRRTPKPGRSS